jgi:hypothetical protein
MVRFIVWKGWREFLFLPLEVLLILGNFCYVKSQERPVFKACIFCWLVSLKYGIVFQCLFTVLLCVLTSFSISVSSRNQYAWRMAIMRNVYKTVFMFWMHFRQEVMSFTVCISSSLVCLTQTLMCITLIYHQIWFLNILLTYRCISMCTTKLYLCYSMNIMFSLTGSLAGTESLFMNHNGFLSQVRISCYWVLKLISSPSMSKFYTGLIYYQLNYSFKISWRFLNRSCQMKLRFDSSDIDAFQFQERGENCIMFCKNSTLMKCGIRLLHLFKYI